MGELQLRFRRVDFEYTSVFRIAYRTRTSAETVLVELQDGSLIGRGEAMGVSYHEETIDGILAQIESVAQAVRKGISRSDLQSLLPPGGARNALDCALWDLEAKRAGKRAWELAGFSSVHPLMTTFTLGIDTPEAMAKSAAASPCALLKLKLMGEGDIERVTAIRKARPDADLVVDANQAWNESQLKELVPKLVPLGVKLIEQPMAIGQDDALAGFKSPIPICADESCQSIESLPKLIGKYDFINIKLDKTGGLTEALRLARAAQQMNFKLMVGCMGGSSIAMAPAFIIGQLCDVIDLDGPLLIKADVPHGIRYEGSRMNPPQESLWG